MSIETKREICKKCDRPSRTCICSFIPESKLSLYDKQSSVSASAVFLQYPKEAKHKKGSVKFAPLVLEHIDVKQCKRICFGQSNGIKLSDSAVFIGDLLQLVPAEASSLRKVVQVLVFPTKKARSLTQIVREQSDQTPIHYQFILIDATWPTATRLYKNCIKNNVAQPESLTCTKVDSQVLKQCRPQGQQPSDHNGSLYGLIRKEVDGGMSTAEALVCSLAELEVPHLKRAACELLRVCDAAIEIHRSFMNSKEQKQHG